MRNRFALLFLLLVPTVLSDKAELEEPAFLNSFENALHFGKGMACIACCSIQLDFINNINLDAGTTIFKGVEYVLGKVIDDEKGRVLDSRKLRSTLTLQRAKLRKKMNLKKKFRSECLRGLDQPSTLNLAPTMSRITFEIGFKHFFDNLEREVQGTIQAGKNLTKMLFVASEINIRTVDNFIKLKVLPDAIKGFKIGISFIAKKAKEMILSAMKTDEKCYKGCMDSSLVDLIDCAKDGASEIAQGFLKGAATGGAVSAALSMVKSIQEQAKKCFMKVAGRGLQEYGVARNRNGYQRVRHLRSYGSTPKLAGRDYLVVDRAPNF